jgi:uncharacterized repeat protein (TIGR03803 family)
VIVDASGNLFGTTYYGGTQGEGTVFELADINGTYASTPTTLYSFTAGFDGANPYSGLITDAAGDLFGTTFQGGPFDGGTVFEITNTNGTYASTPMTLYGFTGAADGANPRANLIMDAAGDLFGTTWDTGSGNAGTVFEIAKVNGSYAPTPTTLATFDGTNGAMPEAGLVMDAAGDLFGTTSTEGANGDGTVFEIKFSNGSYAATPTTLVSFASTDGANPQSTLIMDAAGDLFGTTNAGGADNKGTIFEIKFSNGSYAATPTTLYGFTGGADGETPLAGVIMDAVGDLFGTTSNAGSGGLGTVFELAYTNGSYASALTIVHSFSSADNDGAPYGALTADAKGDLFGTTTFADGTVFEISDAGFQIPCYRRGTRIRTADGDTNVETLGIGDKVQTASGALRPIKWIGRRSYGGRFIMGHKDILPVCFKAGALGDGVPERDLWISPQHAMYFEDHGGLLIEAKDLVNGITIVQAQAVERVDYFHIELDSHDVIVADGALSETFIDDDSRGMFNNAYEFEMLYARDVQQPAPYCAPRLSEGYGVEAVRQRIALRAGLLQSADAIGPGLGVLRGHIDQILANSIAGWAQNVDAPEAPVCLDILADGMLIGRVLANCYRDDLKCAGLGSGLHAFDFTPPPGVIFTPDAVEVRRSLDGAALPRSAHAERSSAPTAAA